MSGPLSLGRMTAALATVHNENSASLATANLDFTLIKVEAPVEFSALGATISRKRKVDAEEGTLHRTARRLGALFGERLPQTEDLFRAYGTRVSEISSIPSINPRQDSNRDGIFASHIGADTTSIWAAVTSGSAAIAAHLLGCMLARVFTGPEAVSAWVELVDKQKEWIRNRQDDGLYSHEHRGALSAAQQDIPRKDLAKWDASARAWLQSADQAKALQHKQTMLILNNASVPVNSESQTYDSIMKAWVVALEAMNNLVKSIPQRVQDGAALLAISSWHLYPDMVVYSGACVQVKQKDSLFDPAALLTLGLQHVRDDTKSVYWSLPLACLQYYGHPVQASRTIGQENARVTYRQFAYIITGCLFAEWDVFAPTNEEGLRWIDRIGTVLELELSTQHLSDTNRLWTVKIWLVHLFVASREYFDFDEQEKRTANQLMNLGRRRSTFLQPPSRIASPIFGLSHIEILLAVLEDAEQRVLFLRKYALSLKLDPSHFLIKYQPNGVGRLFGEYASLLPVLRPQSKRMHDGTMKEGTSPPKYTRWIILNHTELTLCVRRKAVLKDIPEAVAKLQTLKGPPDDSTSQPSYVSDIESTPKAKAKRLKEIEEMETMIAIAKRVLKIEQSGEICLPSFIWDSDTRLVFSREEDFVDASSDILRKLKSGVYTAEGTYSRHYVGEASAAICSITPWIEPLLDLHVSPEFVEEVLKTFVFSKERLGGHLSYSEIRSGSRFDRKELSYLMESLRAYAVMAEVYQLLPGATISALVLGQPLHHAKWIPRGQVLSPRPTLSQAFACIAMFESGICNLDPNALSEVFAMSSGNSLYVAGALLCDPFEQPGRAEIRRVIGNIGRAGISFLISPPEVKIREPDPEKWMAINHDKFDGKLEDHFPKTSLHLSFTDYEIPLVTEANPRHIIDRAVVLIETLISVHDGGDWIGEVDILRTLRSPVLQRVGNSSHEQHLTEKAEVKCQLSYEEALLNTPQLAAISVENWDELLEAPQKGLIAVRAHNNWLARLAIAAVCTKHGFMLIILPAESGSDLLTAIARFWMCHSQRPGS